MYHLTCSIVLYNNPLEDVKNAVESVLGSSLRVKLFLIDNSEEDSFREVFNTPGIEYVFTGKNLGYGKAHNLALIKAKGLAKYHLVLNPDVEFASNVLPTLYYFMEKREDVGMVMPKVLYRNGEIQYLCKMLPSPKDLIMRRFIPKPVKALFRKNMEKYELKHKDYNSIMDIPNLSGCFMFIRTHVFDMIGYFDERYFIYLEDTDLCRRINLFYRTIYYPRISITHGYSKASYNSFHLMKHHLISSLKYFSKWGWFSDGTRSKINKAVLDNRLMPVLESERIKRRSLLNDKQKKTSLKSRSIQEPVIGMVVPFEMLNVSA